MMYNENIEIKWRNNMEFFTSYKEKRPVRLSEKTRAFAYDSLNFKYGLDTEKTFAVALDDGIENMSALEKYDAATLAIAKESPIRICEGEMVSGAATLGAAISHVVPATYKGQILQSSVSHLTIDFPSVVKRGVNALIADAEAAYEKYKGTPREAFAKSALLTFDAMKIWHARYLDALKDKEGYEENYKNLSRVPFESATSFYEAVQSIWFTFAFVRLCGNWPGIGRIDELLGPYLKADLDAGKITLDEAREILAHLFIKGCEWVRGGDRGSGDAQHYQNIVLAGINKDGVEVENEVTYLVLDIIEELGISDFPTTVRLNENTSDKLLTRIAEVVRYGGGVVAVYNENKVIEAMEKAGYSTEEARCFANDGCWETQVPGKTYFIYSPFDSLAILQQRTLASYDGDVSFESFDQLYAAYAKDLSAMVDRIGNDCKNAFSTYAVPTKDWAWKPSTPCTVVSVFEQGCIEKGLSYHEGGPIYNVVSPHIGGLADVANSLYAIKKLVFDEKKLTFSELIKILKNNWEGEEALRQYVQTKYTYYGNDNDEADDIAARVVSDFANFCDAQNSKCGYRFPAGISTFGRQLEWAPHRLATPYGRRAHELLAANASPTPSTDKDGATAIIKSYCKLDLSRMGTGAALDVKLIGSSVDGEDGIDALISLMRGFVALGGFFMQVDVADAKLLREAQQHPDDYKTLSVRVSGWNARFVTLNREWQDMVIGQVER